MAAEQPPPSGVAAKQAALPPNRTLYVRNLNAELRKDDLKRSLYMLFATHGVILDVVALKTAKMKGQAHVVFRDMDAATQAMRALNDFEFFGKPMQIQYAKGQSNIIPKLKGIIPGAAEKAAAAAAAETAEKQNAPTTGFGAVPAKAVPVNEQDRAKGVKRAREDDDDEDAKPTQKQSSNDESDEDDAEMDMSSSDEDD